MATLTTWVLVQLLPHLGAKLLWLYRQHGLRELVIYQQIKGWYRWSSSSSIWWKLFQIYWSQHSSKLMNFFFSRKVFKFCRHSICFWGSVHKDSHVCLPQTLSVVYDQIPFLARPVPQLCRNLPELLCGTFPLLWHSWFCAGPRDLWIAYRFPPRAPDKGDVVEKLSPSSSQEYYSSVPYCPATTDHSKKPLPILAPFRSKWEAGTGVCSSVFPNSTE